MLNQFNSMKRRQFLDRLTLATLGVTTSSSLAEKIVVPTSSNKTDFSLHGWRHVSSRHL